MNEFRFAGTITGIETKTTKTGKSFSNFTLLQRDSYDPNRILHVRVTAFGQAHEEVAALGEQANAVVTGKIDSREWQGKHYLDLKAMRVESL
jgi:hypothetical protein